MEAAAAKLGLQVETLDIRSTSDIDRAFDRLPPGKVDALAVVGDAFLISRRDKIVGLAALRRLPAIYPAREFADNGGLMSYGTRWADMYVIVGSYAGRIMRGAKPAELPVQRPNRYEFVLNLRTARALGLEPPQLVLGRADEVLD
jgi:putative ABC transport system substrate-binding protein